MPFCFPEGAALYYETAGSGPAVIFIHAGIADSRMWDDQWAAFSARYAVVRYDTRGFGRTTTDDIEYSNRADVIALMDTLHVDRAALIGCSRGGNIALDTALEYPERVSALVLACSEPNGFEPAELPMEQIDRFDEIERLFEMGEYEAAVELETHTWVVGFNRPPQDLNESVRERVMLMNLESLDHLNEGGRPIPLDPPAVDRLGQVRCPLLTIIGRYDAARKQLASDLLLSSVPGARQAWFEQSAHMPNMEEPERFNAEVLAFLGDAGL